MTEDRTNDALKGRGSEDDKIIVSRPMGSVSALRVPSFGMIWRVKGDSLPVFPDRSPALGSQAELEDEDLEWWALVNDDGPVSVLAMKPIKSTMRVKAIFTYPEHRGKGYASVLLENVARLYGTRRLTAYCLNTSINLFHRCGFDYTGRSHHCKREAVHIMQKERER